MLFALILLPVASTAAAVIATAAVVRGNDDIALSASLHSVAYSLATVLCWFAL